MPMVYSGVTNQNKNFFISVFTSKNALKRLSCQRCFKKNINIKYSICALHFLKTFRNLLFNIVKRQYLMGDSYISKKLFTLYYESKSRTRVFFVI